jgi:SNF2 family DNA or RNA helicase
MLSAKRKYVLTATPCANYPRDVHALICTTGGDGTAAQPWGFRGHYIDPVMTKTMSTATRGVDQFRSDFLTLEWSVNEFAEDNRTGAKREVPKIANLRRYRQMLAPHVLRRVHHEPEVAKYVHIPVPTRNVTTIDWDPEHLAYYLKIADEFRGVYLKMVADAKERGKKMNLIALLARIRAVQFACSYPQHAIKGFRPYTKLTSKQRYAIERMTELTRQGKKFILYADGPGVLELLGRHMRERNIETVMFHGKIDIETRTVQLDERFRFGDAPCLLASLGVTQTGLNIPQACVVLFYNRAWAAKTEQQAGGRVLRPQQVQDVLFEYLHLKGSIDEYQAQMVAHKQDAALAGLDWGTPEFDQEDFLHIDTILGRFCEDLAELHGCETHELREKLKATA